MNAAVEQMGSDTTAMRPFRVDVPEADLTDLRRRIRSTRLPEKEPVADVSQDLIARCIDGVPESLTRDDVLGNRTPYWLTNTGVSSSRLYRENTVNFFSPKGVNIPVAVSVFPDELYLPPRSWAEKAFPSLVHFNKVARGGHFAAWEQPKIFTDELRAGFRSLRG